MAAGAIRLSMTDSSTVLDSIWRRMWLAWVGFLISAASFPTIATSYTTHLGAGYALVYPGQLVLLAGLVVIGVGLWNGCRARATTGRSNPSTDSPQASN
jgi:hypothetical protein